MDEHAAISIEGLAVRFGSRGRTVEALNDVSLRVRAGEIAGLLGPNGSGKTTLLRTLSGLQRIAAGQVRVLGHPPGDKAVVAAVGVQPDAPLPFPHLGAQAFLEYVGALLGLPATATRARAAALIERLELAHAGRRALRTFSTGMTRRLGFAAAILGEPRVLLLDEPTAGLDPDGSALVAEILREMRTAGAAILLASHHLLEMEELCDEVHLLHRGRVEQSGTLDAVLGEDAVTEARFANLSDDAAAKVRALIVELGGDVESWRPARRHLDALFRELGSQ